MASKKYTKTTYGYKEVVFFGIIDLLVDLLKMPQTTLNSLSNWSTNREVVRNKFKGIPYVSSEFIEAISSIQKVKGKKTKNINSYDKVLNKSGFSSVLQEQLKQVLGDPRSQYNFFTMLDNVKPDADRLPSAFSIVLNNSTSSLPDLVLEWGLSLAAQSKISIYPSTVSNAQDRLGDEDNSYRDIQVLLNFNDKKFNTFDKFQDWMKNNFKDILPNSDSDTNILIANLFTLLSSKTEPNVYADKGGVVRYISEGWDAESNETLIQLTQVLRIYFNTNFQNKLLEYSLGLKVSIIKEAVNALKNIKPKRGGSNLLSGINKKLNQNSLTIKKKQEQIRGILDNGNWDDTSALVKEMFLTNPYITTDIDLSNIDRNIEDEYSAMLANFVGFAIGLNTRIPINALMSMRYLDADLSNFKYKIISTFDESQDSKKFVGISEGYISVKNTSKYFSAISGNITPFGYYQKQSRYASRDTYGKELRYNSAVVLADRISPPLNRIQRDAAIGKFKELNLFSNSDGLSLGDRFNDKNNLSDRNKFYLVNSFNSFYFLSRGYRAAVADILATNSRYKKDAVLKLPTSGKLSLKNPIELNKDYLGYFKFNDKPIEQRKSLEESETNSDYGGAMGVNEVNFLDHPLSENTNYYFQDAYAREKDFPRGLMYLTYEHFNDRQFKYNFKKDGSGLDYNNPRSEQEIIDRLEVKIKANLVEQYQNNPKRNTNHPFQTAVTSFVKGDVVIVSSFYNNEMFGYLTPSFVFENDYVKTPFFKELAYGVTTLASQNNLDYRRQYQRSTPIDVCYAVIQEDMPSDFDIVSDTIKCSVIYQSNGKTIVEDWSLPLANLKSQSGVQTLNITSSEDNNENLGDNLIYTELEKEDLSLANFLANATEQTTINALIRPAYTNIYAKEFTYYELSGYLMDYTNVAKEIGIMQRATLDYKPRLLDLKNFKEEYNSLAKSNDIMKDLTNKYFKGKEDTIVYKYLKNNIREFINLYGKSEKGINEIFKALNSLAKYEAECYVDDESPKPKSSKKEDLKSLIDNI